MLWHISLTLSTHTLERPWGRRAATGPLCAGPAVLPPPPPLLTAPNRRAPSISSVIQEFGSTFNMSPHCKHLFAGLALIVCSLEAGALLSLSLGLSLTGVLSAVGCIWRKQSGPEVEKATPAPTTTVPAPTGEPAPPPPPAPASEPSLPSQPSSERPPYPEPSREPSQPPAPSSEPSTAPLLAGEPSAPASLAPQGSSLLAGEVSFTFCNALAEDSTYEGIENEGSIDGQTALGTVDEFGEDEGAGACCSGGSGDAYEDAEGGQDNDEFEDCCGELVFEPSSSGVPGLRMVPRGISGLGK